MSSNWGGSQRLEPLQPIGQGSGTERSARAYDPVLTSSGKRANTLAPLGSTDAPGTHGKRSKVTLDRYSKHLASTLPLYEGKIEEDFYSDITTGNDAIEYYARYGHGARIKVFYCNRAFPRGQGSPYDLVPVPRQCVDAEYYTVTAAGVVHHPGTPDEEPDYTPIGEWLREQSIYNLMRQMRFFKYYVHLRFFSLWRNLAHRLRFKRMRERIMDRAFMAKPQLCDQILQMRMNVNQMASTPAVNLEEPMYTLEDFLARQKEHRQTKSYTLDSLIDHVKGALLRVIASITKQEENLRREINDFEADPSGGAMRGENPVKTKLLYMEKAKKHRTLKMEVELLPNLVRMMDLMVVGALTDVVSGAISSMLGAFSDRGLVSASVAFADEGRTFSPDIETVRTELSENFMEHVVKLVNDVPRLINHQQFLPLFQKQIGRKAIGPDLASIVLTSKDISRNRMLLEKGITQSYRQAAESTAPLEELRQIVEFGREWDADKYSAEEKDLAQFRKDMMLMRAWNQQVDGLQTDLRAGMLTVSVQQMQGGLGAIVQSALDTMRNMLIIASRQECQKVLSRFQGFTQSMSARPTDLHGYAGFLEEVLGLEARREELIGEAKLVDDMYDMLAQYKADVPPNDQLVVDDLKEGIASFNKSFEESQEFVEKRKDEKIEALESDIRQLFDDLQEVVSDLRSGTYDEVEGDAEGMVAALEDLSTRYGTMQDLAGKYAHYQDLMQLDQTDYESVNMAGRELKWHQDKWTMLRDFEVLESQWMSASCWDLDPEEIQTQLDEFTKANYKAIKARKDDAVCVRMKRELDEFKGHMNLLTLISDKAIKDRHWEDIYKLVGEEYVAGETQPNVRLFVEKDVMVQQDALEVVVGNAVKENNLLKNLDKLEKEWEGQEFRVVAYKNDFVIGGVDDIQTILDDQIVKIQAMNAQPFMKPFEERGKTWEQTLTRLQDILDYWLKVQSTWMYLEPIFSSDDIVKQMPEEGAKFGQVDGHWKELMSATKANPEVIQIGGKPEVLEVLVMKNGLLEEIQKGLSAYLEKKRLFFPRFFFLSNDDMLEILSETKDPTRVQPHLRKCFEAIDKLTFDDSLKILQMISVEGEAVDFKDPVDTVRARGAVEKWLVEVEEAMVSSVHDVVRRGMERYPEQERHEWVLEWPGAVVLVVTAMFWTSGVIDALKKESEGAKGTLATYEKKCTDDLLRIVDLVRGELTGLQRATLGALVVMDVHARDVVTSMVRKGVETDQDFEWQAQLRTYWQEDKEGEKGMTVMMQMMSAEIEYGYEYLGNSSRLVITPLTDRCYRTLMGAIHLTLGGAPEGPAGTGKTETTKDLAKALARQCVVFNCSDQLDYIAMGKFFKGLASSGAWACFDEFNRINLEVLSVVAQQVLDIQRAITARMTEFFFEGTQLRLKWTAWCAITMNPGYAGRSELPDNLKALFRTVAMMVPDYAMIAEIILFSYGYLKARECSKKIVQCYKLCSEQLSSQDHYDYGMRAVIAVLRAAGNLKRRYPDEEEFVLMLRSIIDVNLCKFLSEDVPLFQGITSDLFPGVTLPSPDYDLMHQAMREACTEMNLEPTDYFFLKTTQLYEMIVVRHGLMIVGLPFSGKTKSYQVLAKALTMMHERGQEGQDEAEFHVINPKSVTMGQLYGQFDPATHEWSDGVLAVKFRHCANDRTTKRKWLVLDGPVDAIWIENMNTVLDDNKKLCLNSGEIIQMSTNHSMIFEVMDLAVASPATVSRCGMVYLEPHQLGWRPLLSSWLKTLPPHFAEEDKALLNGLFEWLVPVSLRFLRREIKELSPTLDTNLAVTLMRMFTASTDHLGKQVTDYEGNQSWDKGQWDALGPEKCREHIESLFLFSLVWSIGCTGANYDLRVEFDRFFRKAVAGDLASYDSRSGEKYDGSSFPEDVPESPPQLTAAMFPEGEGSTVFDFFFDTDMGAWRQWVDIMDTDPIPLTEKFRSIIVPTVDTVRYTYLMNLSVSHQQPMLIVGETGTGKSVYVQRFIKTLPSEEYAPAVLVGFSARTTANMTQHMIDGKMDRRPPKRLGIYGPAGNKKAVVFVDDLNMPAKEEYGAQPPIELLRQWMDHQGWYDRENSFRTIKDVQFLCAMGPPGGGRTFITPRYARHFNTVVITEFDNPTLNRIFTSILDWYMGKEGLPDSLCNLKQGLISATLDVYQKVSGTLLPTPTKSHYVFNLRDISRVMQGLQLGSKAIFPDGAAGKDKMIRLWFHETLRVFYDRLVDDKDRTWFLDYLKEVVPARFDTMFEKVFAALIGKGGLTTDAVRKCFFGDFLDDSAEGPGDRSYDELTDTKLIIERVEEYLVDHNAMSKRPMNLAVFLYACEHVSRVCRALKQPGAHILNVGLGGSGRQSLSRLASFIMGMEVFQIEISKSYGVTEWREDLKRFTTRAGGDNVPCVFLFSDTQIKIESFVEDINNLLNAGEIPNMFPYDERSAIKEKCRNLAKKQGIVLETDEEMWSWFVDHTKANLHIVLCMSPVGDAFRERLRQFPALVNCCTINWYQAWPNDALEAVANKFLAEVDITEKVRADVTEVCKTFHNDVKKLSEEFRVKMGRHNYVTPTSYLELINMFKAVLGVQRDQVSKAKKRYEIGLEKLAFTADQVAKMQGELEALLPELGETVKATEALMAQVAKEKEEVVEPKKAIVDVEVEKASEKAAAANAIKEECESALAEALPALEAAESALKTVKPADIKMVTSYVQPPGAVKLVMEGVCVMLNVAPTKTTDPATGKKVSDYWPAAKKELMDPKFLSRLLEYDKDNIDLKIITKIREVYLTNEDFTVENAKNASSAAAGMCKWIYAMSDYDRVAKIVAPKRAELAVAEGEYATVKAALDEKQAELKEVMDNLAGLERTLEESKAKMDSLQQEVDLCKTKLSRAEQLIQGLGGEKDRWNEASVKLGEKYDNLTGDMLISAGVMGYLGAFTLSYRDKVVQQWIKLCKNMGIPSSAKFSLNEALGDPVKIRQWTISGLPNDAFSIDNAIMMANARRWPLLIDPQGQANKWIKEMEKGDLRVIKLSDSDYLRTLENAIQFGLPVLLENVLEELDPSLEPLLLKNIFKSGGTSYIQLGDTQVEYSDGFRFYITTALRNPHYLPEVAVKVTLLNFMITQDGLSDQLLGVVVAEERPDLEEQRSQLVIQSAENKKKLKEIEDEILHVLSSSQGNILEDEAAIQVLGQAKVVSNEIEEKQKVADETQAEIDQARKEYAPCGAFNSVLFFCIADLAGIDPMYQYSLAWFISLFVRSIRASEKADDVEARLKIINDHFTYSLYKNVCRSLFEKDKLLFAFLLDVRIMLAEEQLKSSEYTFLLTGGVGIDPIAEERPEAPWLSDRAWAELTRAAAAMEALADVPSHIKAHLDDWRAVVDAMEPQSVELPGGLDSTLSPFQKLILLRCIRSDKLVPATSDFVSRTMGQKYIEPPPFDLQGSFAESSCTVPLLFVLSTGSDPTASLLKFADDRGFGSKIDIISMGQGQGTKAAKLIHEGRSAGRWVLLQNCHLAPSWMPELEKITESITADNTDGDFRLWMMSMPSPAFPVSILQNGVKMTMEPPAGLRANMKRSLTLDPISNETFFEGCSKPDEFKKLLFGLVFVHAFVQERRKYGPIGWNIPYGFDDGDLRISARQLRMYLDENDAVPYDALKYAIGECNYGGRVTDDKDRRLLMTVMERVYRGEILEDHFKLSTSGTYCVPLPGSLSEAQAYVGGLPMTAMPEAFGLHENADITKDLQATGLMLTTLLSTGGGSGGGEGAGQQEETVARMVRETLERLPDDFDIEKAQHKYPVLYEESMNQVLCQEMLRYNRLTAIIRNSLRNLDKALQGLQVMSAELDGVFRAMAVGAVPELWKGKSFPSLKPLSGYVEDLLARLGMLQRWYEEGQPASFWISGFFFTPAFTTASLQNYARKLKLPIDTVGFDFETLSEGHEAITQAPEDGVYIYGLYLEGCAWDADARLLRESFPKQLFCSAPVLWLRPKQTQDFVEFDHYNCPVYRTGERRGTLATTGHSTNFLMYIKMPSSEPEYHWTMRGVCMLCSLSD